MEKPPEARSCRLHRQRQLESRTMTIAIQENSPAAAPTADGALFDQDFTNLIGVHTMTDQNQLQYKLVPASISGGRS